MSCLHCGLPVKNRSGDFCCLGCETVYGILQDQGLGRYYDLKSRARAVRPAVAASLPASRALSEFDYMDDDAFARSYVTCREGSCQVTRSASFFSGAIHCVACVWLLEGLAERIPGVEGARVDLSRSLVTFDLNPEGRFSTVAYEMARLGYRPSPVQAQDVTSLQTTENRSYLTRLGVAGAAAANIMLLAASVYAGAEGELAKLFGWISFGFYLPVVLYSAQPFYRSAWASLRSKRLSIDVPVVLGLTVGGGVSAVNLLRGQPGVFFDSLSGLVFLLLASRFLLRRAQQHALDSTRLSQFLIPGRVRVWRDGHWIEAALDSIRVGEKIEVRAGETVPLDGTLASERAYVDSALMTGESRPQAHTYGATLNAGIKNLEGPIQLVVTHCGSDTRLARILSSVDESLRKKASIEIYSDRVGQVFTGLVVALMGLAFFLGLREGLQEGLDRAIAFSLVACPCAFALATPLAFARAMALLASRGIWVRNSEVIEKLARVEEVFLDKTGTLTTDQLSLATWIADQDDHEVRAAVVALESRSNHPVARALVEAFEVGVDREQLPEVSEYREVIGRGISGVVRGERYELKREEQGVGVWRSGRRVALARFHNPLRPDSVAAVASLERLGLRPWILSGDSKAHVYEVADAVGIPRARAVYGATPEDKRRVVEQHPNVLMVGDGANDAIALASASVGLAAHTGIEVALRSADAFYTQPSATEVARLVTVGRETLRVVHRNLRISLLYNGIAGIAALGGWVTPLFAAVLMPAIATLVLVSALSGTRTLRLSWRLA